MKQIKFKKVDITNFKGIRSGEFTFGDYITTISGPNGIGKTTIVDAIVWCLFGINSKGMTKFGLKTRGEDGEEIREIPHEVELTMSVDGMERILKRSVSESVSSDGVITNKFSYHIDGDVVTAGDYVKKINEICQFSTFRYCSTPTYFVSLPWHDQRDFLIKMVGQIEMKDVCGDDTDLMVAAKEAEVRGSIENVIKHYAYARKEVTTRLDDIPVRLKELEKALPIGMADNKTDYNKEVADINAELTTLRENLAKMKTGGADDIRETTIRKKISFARRRLSNMEISMQNQSHEASTTYHEELRNAKRLVSESEDSITDLKNKLSSLNQLVERCGESLKNKEEEKADGAKEWNTLVNLKWNNDGVAVSDVCPVCGQYYPREKFNELINESKRQFNIKLADQKQKCIEKATRIKDEISIINKEIDDYRQQIKDTSEQLANAEKILDERKKHMDEVEKDAPKTYSQLLDDNENYKQVSEEIKSLEKSLNEGSVDGENQEIVKKTEKEITEKEKSLENLMSLREQQKTCKNIASLMCDVRKEKVKLQTQLDDIDTMLDRARDLNLKYCKVVECLVNSHFQTVEWSMFHKNLDGTVKTDCECSYHGIPFSDLNTAAQINAGLEICYGIAKFKQTSIPVFVDGAESVTDIVYDGGQQIRMAVSSADELTFQYDED